MPRVTRYIPGTFKKYVRTRKQETQVQYKLLCIRLGADRTRRQITLKDNRNERCVDFEPFGHDYAADRCDFAPGPDDQENTSDNYQTK